MDDDLCRVLRRIDAHRMRELLIDFARIPSPPEQTVEAAEWYAGCLRASGAADVQLVRDRSSAPSVIAGFPGLQRRPTLQFCGRLDTPPLGRESAIVRGDAAEYGMGYCRPGFDGTHIMGRGVAGGKGGLIAAAEAARVLLEEASTQGGCLPGGGLLFVAHAGQEPTAGADEALTRLVRRGVVGDAVVLTQGDHAHLPIAGLGLGVFSVLFAQDGAPYHERRHLLDRRRADRHTDTGDQNRAGTGDWNPPTLSTTTTSPQSPVDSEWAGQPGGGAAQTLTWGAPADSRAAWRAGTVASGSLFAPGHWSVRTPYEAPETVIDAAQSFAMALRRRRATLQRHPDPLAGAESIFVSAISGGDRYDRIPPSCKVEGNWRWIPARSPEGVALEIRRLAEAAAVAHGVRVTVSWTVVRDSFRLPNNSPLVGSLLGAHRSVVGYDLPLGGSTFASDAAIFLREGGVEAVCHGVDTTTAYDDLERIRLDELVRVARVYVAMAYAYLRQRSWSDLLSSGIVPSSGLAARIAVQDQLPSGHREATRRPARMETVLLGGQSVGALSDVADSGSSAKNHDDRHPTMETGQLEAAGLVAGQPAVRAGGAPPTERLEPGTFRA